MAGIRLVTVCLSVTMALAVASRVAAAPLIYVEPDTSEVWTGGDVWVDIAINDEVSGVTGYDLLIDFDESIVEVVDVLEGSLPQSAANSFFFWTIDPVSSNAIDINGAILGSSVDGPGVLASILFHAVGEGESPVELLDVELRDIDNHAIAVGAKGGVVSVNDPPAIYLTPQLSEEYEGAIFSIDVAINVSLTGLTGYSLAMAIDPAIVRFIDAVEGPLPSSEGADTYFYWTLEGAESDTLVINGAVLGDWIDGPGVIATVSFLAFFQGTSEVEFAAVDLRDIDNNAIYALSQDAVVVVLPGGSSSENTSWTSIKTMFR
ncbi:MAG: hypothetical protein JXB46_09755 [Candidatus Eisenbacteria bacterium]|nr:hypothetical protein [Candidatus Eisenbacteria bacterium]